MIEIILKDKNKSINIDILYDTFPAGEEYIRIANTKEIKEFINNQNIVFTIISRIYNSKEMMQTMLIIDAINKYMTRLSYYNYSIDLILPYLPYSRQDRVCHNGESFGLEVILNILLTSTIDTIYTFDKHSNILNKYISDIEQPYIFENTKLKNCKFDIIVSPDKGALLKNMTLFEKFDIAKEIISADKVRNNDKVNITLDFEYGYFKDKDIFIADDIIDGGRTMIELVKIIKEDMPKSITVYCTHGIFSAGTQCLFDAGINKIITTNSYYNGEASERLEVLKIEDIIKGI